MVKVFQPHHSPRGCKEKEKKKKKKKIEWMLGFLGKKRVRKSFSTFKYVHSIFLAKHPI